MENGEIIGQVGERGYKDLCILEKGDICQEKKENIRKNTRLRAILKSKLNAKHVFQAINTLAVPTV